MWLFIYRANLEYVDAHYFKTLFFIFYFLYISSRNSRWISSSMGYNYQMESNLKHCSIYTLFMVKVVLLSICVAISSNTLVK